jgi:hypothetical protein
MPVRLTDVDIHILSLVDKAANQRSLIIKNAIPSGASELDRTCVIRKIDEDLRRIYSIVYAPGQTDAHGEYMTKDDVREACYGFMRKSRTGNVDTQHDCVVDKDCHVVENWLVRKNDEIFPDKTDLDAWSVAMEIKNDEIWDKIKKGEITGVSMWGTGKKIQEEESVEKGFYEIAKNFFTGGSDPVVKEFEDRIKRYELRTACDALTGEIYNVISNDLLSLKERQAEVVAVAEQFIEYVDEIEIAKQIIEKEGRTLSNKNLTAVRAALKNLNDILTAADSKEEKVEKLKKSIVEKKKETPSAEAGGNKADETVVKSDKEKELEALVKSQKEEIEKLKSESRGSEQEPEPGSGDQKPVKKSFNWLG